MMLTVAVAMALAVSLVAAEAMFSKTGVKLVAPVLFPNRFDGTWSGQIIAGPSHDRFTPQKVVKEGKWDPLFQENLGW